MKEYDNIKIHIFNNFILSICFLIMLRHLITSTITTLQHFVTLHHTSPNYTSLHLSTLHFLSFTLHYPLIWLNPFTFPTFLFHLTSLNKTQYSSYLQIYFQNNDPLHCPGATILKITQSLFHYHLWKNCEKKTWPPFQIMLFNNHNWKIWCVRILGMEVS
jgi:hypothetical protein